ncbi:MAG: replication factor C large subunit [Thermoplasmatales archaeon]|jgi:replication factor C large subunit|nr:replication factor C large subunit [Thermoplasmatales archaeon]
MAEDWTEKYRPKTVRDVVGNPKAVSDIMEWADDWSKGAPKKKAAVLMGSPGIGKTSLALALASEMGWGLVEMNASDQRTGGAIRSVALKGSLSNTFSDTGEYLDTRDGGMKLIVLDEADNIFGNADRGGVPAISELIKETKQPVILIVNDFYDLSRKSSAVKNDTLQIKFQKPSASTVAKALRTITENEGIEADDLVLRALAENAGGDLRAAVRDLQSVSAGKDALSVGDTGILSERTTRKNMYDLMYAVFRKGDPVAARRAAFDVDEEPSYIQLWVEENLPYEYTDTGDLVRGCERMSRADIYLGRVHRRQYYGLWSYAVDMMTAGVSEARRSSPDNRNRFRFPSYLMKMSRSKSVRNMKKNVADKLGTYLHTSRSRIDSDVMPSLKAVLKNDQGLRASMIRDVGLEVEELAFLLDTGVDSPMVKLAVKDAEPPKAITKSAGGTAEGKKAEKPKPVTGQKSLFQF